MAYGPLYEAWVQKKDMPFILVVPQLHMFGRDGPDGPAYIRNRTKEGIPKRLEKGISGRSSPQKIESTRGHRTGKCTSARRAQVE